MLSNMKLSFIVPVYNVAPYLRKCMDSLLAQDFDDYEIILVDDGSTDNSGAICDEYASTSFASLQQSIIPIRVIHQTNAGLSAARNSGIKIANGEYLCFVDSDDYWQHNVLAGLMSQIECDNLDVLRFRLQYVNPDGEVYNPYKSDPFNGNNYSAEPTDGVSFLNSRMSTACYAWTFIVKRELLVDCIFTPGIYFEDTDWTPRLLCKAKRVASANTIVYNYLQREGSITNAVNQSKKKKVLDDKMRLVCEMQRQSKELKSQGKDNRWFAKMIAATVVSVIEAISTSFYNKRKEYLAQLNELNVLPLMSYSLKTRLINISPRMVVELINLKNIMKK